MPLRGEGSCGGGGAPRDSAGSGNSRIPPQLEKNHVVPTSWQDEALARQGVSREVPCSALTNVQESHGLVAALLESRMLAEVV